MVEVNRILDKTYNLTLTWDVFKQKTSKNNKNTKKLQFNNNIKYI